MFLELNSLCTRVNIECVKHKQPPLNIEQVSIVLDVLNGKQTATLTEARKQLEYITSKLKEGER